LGSLDLGDDPAVTSGGAQQLPGLVHVIGAAREGNGDVIGLHFGGRTDVFAVLVGQRLGRQTAALTIDALVVREFSADHHAANHLAAIHLVHPQHDASVVEQQGRAAYDV